MDICTRIKTRRKANGLTQEDLSEKLGVSIMTVRRWEWGEQSPNVSVMPKLAEVLNTSVSYLMGLDSNPTPGQQVIPAFAEPVSKGEKAHEDINTLVSDEEPVSPEETGQTEQIVYDFGDHHLKLPATEAGYAAFNNFVATITASRAGNMVSRMA